MNSNFISQVKEKFPHQLDEINNITQTIDDRISQLDKEIDGIKNGSYTAKERSKLDVLREKQASLEQVKKTFGFRMKKVLTCKSKKAEEQLNREMKRAKACLPIYPKFGDIVNHCIKNRQFVLIGETGSGKTTQVPQYILEDYKCSGDIVCTQPRRLAATSLSNRVAQEWGCEVGEEVKCDIGNTSSNKSKESKEPSLVFTTEGMLLRKLRQSPNLKKYSVVIIDEAHERSITTDILLGELKRATQERKDLTVIVMSATINQEKFTSFFNDCRSLKVSGRAFPVDVIYSPPRGGDGAYVQEAAQIAVKITKSKSSRNGDILVFLASPSEIEEACNLTKKLLGKKKDALVLPLHGQLQQEDQQKVFEPTKERKIIYSTNIAETSVTIDGVVYVIDSGMQKAARYDAKKGMNMVELENISQSSAIQRKGRAGRTQSGVCYRLYSEIDFETMPEAEDPEILRSHLSHCILKLKSLPSVNSLNSFNFLDSPDRRGLERAEEELTLLGALNNKGKITRVGSKMSLLELEPKLGKFLLEAQDRGCLSAGIAIASIVTSGRSVFYLPMGKKEKKLASTRHSRLMLQEGDFLAGLNVYIHFLNQSKKGVRHWAKEHYINLKTLDGAQSQIREIIGRLVTLRSQNRIPNFGQIKSYLKPIDLTDDSKAELKAKIMECIVCSYFTNTAQSNGPKSSGYSLRGDLNTINAQLHPSASLVAFEMTPEYVIFDSVVSTSRVFVRGVNTVTADMLENLVPRYFSQFLRQMPEPMSPTELEPMSNALKATLIGKQGATCQDLERKLDIVLEVGDKVIVWARSDRQAEALSKISSFLNEKRAELEAEREVLDTVGTTRVLFGAGGVCQDVLFFGEFIQLLVSNVAEELWDSFHPDNIQKLFERQGGPVMSAINLGSSQSDDNTTKGLITFEKKEDAMKAFDALDQFIIGGQTLKLKPLYSLNEQNISSTEREIIISVKFEKCKGTAVASFSDPSKATMALSEFYNHQKSGEYKSAIAHVDKKNSSAIYISSLASDVNDLDLRKSFGSFEPKSLKVLTEQIPPPDTEFLYQSIMSLISISRDENPEISLFTPKKKGLRGFVRFQKEESVKRLLDTSRHFLTDIGMVHFLPNLTINYSLHKNVYKVIKKDIHAVHEQLQFYLKEPPKIKTYVNIKCTCNSFDHLDRVARALSLVTCPAEIKKNIHTLVKNSKGKTFIAETEKRFFTYINWDKKADSIKVYGSPSNKRMALAALQEYLQANQNIGEKFLELGPGDMVMLHKSHSKNSKQTNLEHLETQYSASIQICSFGQKSSIKIVVDDQEQLNGLLSELKELKQSHSKSVPKKRRGEGNEDEECGVCICDIEPDEESYRLLVCGHEFHTACLEMMFNIVKKQKGVNALPLKCPQCEKPLVVRDIFNMVPPLERQDFAYHILNHFMISSNKIAPCPTPDCPQVGYSEDINFKCSVCTKSYCMPCSRSNVATQPHPGTDCATNNTLLALEDFQKCPKCDAGIQKSEGCMHMKCVCGTHFCWRCLWVDETKGKTIYKHMDGEECRARVARRKNNN
eukprot:gb/GECH01000437.1/.p1 GENE.gb/GECH01000437.1/~~gb/GECH01000437.1/.p1  ORF type:complete len:1545 (+),score=293.73 gb/GECH01000437.1/:1-4635(+)